MNDDASKLTKDEICSLLLSCYATKEDPKKSKKPDLVKKLEDLIRGHPERLVTQDPAAQTMTTAAATP